MDPPVHSLAGASLRNNLRNHKNVTEEEEERLKRIFGKVLRKSSCSNCNYAEEHLEDNDVMLNRIFGNVPKRSRYTKYVNVSPTDGYEFEKCHFVKGMSAIRPAVHREPVLQPRPLSPVVLPCLQQHLLKCISLISDIFPLSAISSELTNPSFGSAIPFVNRPQLLLLGGEGVGLDHLGPAILHELTQFPIYWLRHPCLLSDPGAKTPDETLVHIFSEARRTTPSILYIPRLNQWWQNEYKQLRDLFLTLLEELPSDLPILLLATSHEELSDLEELSVFENLSVYTVDEPSREDRSLFFDHLIEAALSVISGLNDKSDGPPKVPKAPTGLKTVEIKAKVDTEQHALRRLCMCLRDVCNRILDDERLSAFHFPVTEEEAPIYCSIIENPMDITTLLQRVNAGQYLTCSSFLDDVYLILKNAKAYYGNDYTTSQIVSRAHMLHDEVYLMLSEIDPALQTYCDKIAAQAGPKTQSDLSGSVPEYLAHAVDMGTVASTSARLPNVQPQVDLERDSGLKEPNKTADAVCTDQAAESLQHQESGQEAASDISSQIKLVKGLLMEHSENYSIPQMEKLYARIMRGVHNTIGHSKIAYLTFLSEFAQDQANF